MLLTKLIYGLRIRYLDKLDFIKNRKYLIPQEIEKNRQTFRNPHKYKTFDSNIIARKYPRE